MRTGDAVVKGGWITIYVCLIAYAGALLLGLIVGLARTSGNRAVLEATSFYVEIIRGVPMLVLLYYIAFVGAPGLVDLINWAGEGFNRIGLAWIGNRLAAFNVRNLDFTVFSRPTMW